MLPEVTVTIPAGPSGAGHGLHSQSAQAEGHIDHSLAVWLGETIQPLRHKVSKTEVSALGGVLRK